MGKKFLFVRGYQKSGTNWVNNLLNLHPQVICRGEYHFPIILKGIQSFLQINNFNTKFDNIARKHFEGLIKDCLTHNTSKKPAFKTMWFGDKTPWNFNWIESHVILEDASYILISRDPRDILVSQIYHRLRHLYMNSESTEFQNVLSKYPSIQKKLALFKDEPSYFNTHPTELLTDESYIKEVMLSWSNHMEAQNRWLKMVDKDYPRIRIHQVSYEDLSSNFEEERNKLFEFLHLDPSKALDPGALETPGFQHDDNLSHYRKGMVGDWKNYFTKNSEAWVKETAGNMLISEGYEKDLDWSVGAINSGDD